MGNLKEDREILYIDCLLLYTTEKSGGISASHIDWFEMLCMTGGIRAIRGGSLPPLLTPH